jgi:ATPase subunit of ABC transporter with duplicated ATPase domains
MTMRLGGGRTGKQVLECEGLALAGLTKPFDLQVWFGERLAVIGPNGTGKSHFLRLVAGQAVAHVGRWRLGARVVPGYFCQTHDRPDLAGRRVLEILAAKDLVRGPAMQALGRYELQGCAEQPFDTLSGGQQARLQILLLEVGGSTLLVLDEPTDNLDLASAEALEEALAVFEGTVVAVTHDRWFMRTFERFVVFDASGEVSEGDDPTFA